MNETTNAAPAAASATAVTPASPSTETSSNAPTLIIDAGASLKDPNASWESLGFASMDVTDGADETPAGETPAAEQPESVPSTDEGPEFIQNAQGQWHRPDGTFASADEIAQIEAQLAAESAATPSAEPATEPVAENVVTLRRRDGSTREVVIDDPELAEEIRTNYNDGMRRKEFAEKSAALDAKLARINQIDALIDTNPELVIQQSLSDDQQVQLATMLLARHFERLVPIIQGFDTDPGKRIEETASAQRRITEQQTAFTQRTEAAQRAVDAKIAVESLIPDTASPELAQQFMQDAAGDLTRALKAGDDVTKDSIPRILAARLTLYGFSSAGATPAAERPRIALKSPASSNGARPTPAASTPPVAQPANAAAKSFAETQASNKRLRLTQQNRRNAAAVPPVGAGAAPVRLPAVQKGSSIEQASAALKKQRSWTS